MEPHVKILRVPNSPPPPLRVEHPIAFRAASAGLGIVREERWPCARGQGTRGAAPGEEACSGGEPGPKRGKRERRGVEDVERLDGASEEVDGEAVDGHPDERHDDGGDGKHSAGGVRRRGRRTSI